MSAPDVPWNHYEEHAGRYAYACPCGWCQWDDEPEHDACPKCGREFESEAECDPPTTTN